MSNNQCNWSIDACLPGSSAQQAMQDLENKKNAVNLPIQAVINASGMMLAKEFLHACEQAFSNKPTACVNEIYLKYKEKFNEADWIMIRAKLAEYECKAEVKTYLGTICVFADGSMVMTARNSIAIFCEPLMYGYQSLNEKLYRALVKHGFIAKSATAA